MSHKRTMQDQPNNPLHGINLKTVLTELVDYFGFEQLGQMITIRCFTQDPSIQSSLKFLRKTPWARDKVEALYLASKSRPGFAQPDSKQS